MPDLLGRSKSYVLAQLKNIKTAKPEEKRRGKPFVTISRQSGAYGMTIAEMLVDYLQKKDRRQNCPWTVFDKNLIQKVIAEYDFPEEFEKYFAEIPVRPVQDILEEILGVHPTQETLVQKMSKTIFRLAQLGYVILVGRGANIITRSLPMGLHVRLVGSLDKRISHMQDYLSFSEKQARDYVLKEEDSRQRYLRKYFNKDINDVAQYDLVINTDTVPIEEAVQAIGDLVLHGRCNLFCAESLYNTKI